MKRGGESDRSCLVVRHPTFSEHRSPAYQTLSKSSSLKDVLGVDLEQYPPVPDAFSCSLP